MLYEIMLSPAIHCGTKPTAACFLSTGRVSINPRSGAPKAQWCDLLWVKTSLTTDLLLPVMKTWSQRTQWFSPEELANYTDKRCVRVEAQCKVKGIERWYVWRGSEGMKDCEENIPMER